jgi:drug/metabolite transporter (DMT)-like permease
MVVTTVFFVLAHASVKLLSHLPLHQIIFARLFFSLGLCLVYFYFKNIKFYKFMTWPLFLRGLFGSIALVFYFYTLTVMPLATAITLNYLSPIFSLIFAIFVLQEIPPRRAWIFISTAFGGVMLTKSLDASIANFDFFAALMGAMFAGLAYTFVRKAGLKSHPMMVIFLLPLVGIVPSTVSLFVFDFVWPSPWDFFVLLMMSLLVFMAQFFMTLAYSTGEVAKVSIITYLSVL